VSEVLSYAQQQNSVEESSSSEEEEQRSAEFIIEEFDEEEVQYQDEEEPETVFEGWLEKKSEFHHTWKKRWVSLKKGGPLFYYDKEQSDDPAGMIYLQNARLTANTSRNGVPQPLWFGIRSTNKDFVFQCSSEVEKADWCNVIAQNITQSATNSNQGEERRAHLGIFTAELRSGSFFFTGQGSKTNLKPRLSKSSTALNGKQEQEEQEESDEDLDIIARRNSMPPNFKAPKTKRELSNDSGTVYLPPKLIQDMSNSPKPTVITSGFEPGLSPATLEPDSATSSRRESINSNISNDTLPLLTHG